MTLSSKQDSLFVTALRQGGHSGELTVLKVYGGKTTNSVQNAQIRLIYSDEGVQQPVEEELYSYL